MIMNKSIATIQLIAPSSACPKETLELAINNCANANYDLVYHRLLQTPHHPYFAQSDSIAAHQLIEAIQNPYSDLIWAIRGGWGSLRLLPFLDKIKKHKQKKYLMGFSDITFLHVFLNLNWNWKTIHGPNFSSLATLSKSKIKKIINDIQDNNFPTLTGLVALNESAKNCTHLDGKLTGGNLRVIQSMLGTKWHPKFANRILFLEDVGERGYSIDRMLTQLEHSHALEKVKAIVLGDFSEGLERNGKDYKKYALNDFAKRSSIPVFYGAKAGHGKINLYMLFNEKYSISKANNKFIMSLNRPL